MIPQKSRMVYLKKLEMVYDLPALTVCMNRIDEINRILNQLRDLEAPSPVIEQALRNKACWQGRLIDAMYRETMDS